MFSPFPLRATWAEIDLDCIKHNINEFRRFLGPKVQIMAVVKADGYGHGAVDVSRAALEAGASSLAVAMIDEGIELRRAGLEAPILLLGFTGPSSAPLLHEHRLTPILYDPETTQALGSWFAERNAELSVHVKLDTGMGRVGLRPEEAVDFITAVVRQPGLKLEGVLTHLAAADAEEGRSFTENQLKVFDAILETCKTRGIEPSLCHAANSAAALQYPESRYNLVRLGISLYGHYPFRYAAESPIDLRPALSFKSRIIFIKEVPPGTSISYGCTYRTREKALIASVPVGYADGYSRRLSNSGKVLVRGKRVPVVGRICMDHFMIDVSAVPGVARGDEVVIYGGQDGAEVTVEEMAEKLGTISYELLCAVGKRVPRLYFRGGHLSGGAGSFGRKNI